ncbi:MAG: redox-sensing transcriptional repressor Rex [Actinobacteria bacterium]|uniref:Redox-sensing transcriptional repressor Rex n=1 Tax=hydrothermal vent metagenome TaxID=652676 RepID=A0A3B0T8U2_9ZZZZ|nr:redox-sensing transcriptional repressor Rex [Actinomycetota bacterium]
MKNITIPSATISRLPVYLRSLGDMPPSQATISSEQLAQIVGLNSAQVRKDLSYLGAAGVRGVGYGVAELRVDLREALGLTHGYGVAIVGAGNLGAALTNYGGFEAWGFEMSAIFDTDSEKIGSRIGDLVIEDLNDLPRIVEQRDIAIGIVATPASGAQDVVNRFVASGVRSILNFAPSIVQVPSDVVVRRVDLSTELQILTYHLHHDEATG